MEDKSRIDFLWKIIGRFDTYYGAINNKASLLIVFNVFVFSGVIVKYAEILPDYNNCKPLYWIIWFLWVIIIISTLLSLFYIFKVVSPFLKSYEEPTKYLSNIFYEHVVKKENIDKYTECISNLTEKEAIEDLCKQTHSLAQGLNYKFSITKWVVRFMIFGQLLPILVILILKILIHNSN